MLSVIIPAFNEEKMIRKAAKTISGILENEKIDYELLFIDDGSRDQTWSEIQAVSNLNYNCRGIHFSRNFGKESAMFAGLEKASGDCCIVLDCDLQHPPEKIPEMYHLWEQGFEVVEGIKKDRGTESGVHKLAAHSFYSLISRAIGMDMSSSSDFKLLDRKVVDTLNQMPERNVFFRALSFWVGFNKTELPYCVQDRTDGESKWSTKSLFRYAITNITSFSSTPLHFISILGILMFIIALIFSVITLIQKFSGAAAEGFTTVIILLLFTGSIIMLSLGVIAYYIGKMYDELKGRPRYIISSECGAIKYDRNNQENL